MEQFDKLIRDIEEGIIVVDNSGTILHVNPKAAEVLCLKKDYTGGKYVSLIGDDTEKNDDFNQMIIDAVTNNRVAHKKRLKYRVAGGEEKILKVVSSALKDDVGDGDGDGDGDGEISGVILSFDDVTREANLEKRANEAAITFIALIAFLCFWTFVFDIWNDHREWFPSTVFGKVIAFTALLLIPFFVKRFGYTVADLGLRLRGTGKYILIDFLFTFGALVLLGVLKLIIMKVIPSYTFYCADGRFLDFGKYPVTEYLSYIAVSFSQELLSRGLVYESVRRVFITRYDEKRADLIAIFVSSCYFACLHVSYGPVYMVGAFVLLSLFGFIYNKQKTVFGLCIPHFVLGFALGVYGFVAY